MMGNYYGFSELERCLDLYHKVCKEVSKDGKDGKDDISASALMA